MSNILRVLLKRVDYGLLLELMNKQMVNSVLNKFDDEIVEAEKQDHRKTT